MAPEDDGGGDLSGVARLADGRHTRGRDLEAPVTDMGCGGGAGPTVPDKRRRPSASTARILSDWPRQGAMAHARLVWSRG